MAPFPVDLDRAAHGRRGPNKSPEHAGSCYRGSWATEAPAGGVVFASITTPRPGPLRLHRATLKVAAVSVWGLAQSLCATDFFGSGLEVNYHTGGGITAPGCAAGVRGAA